MTNNSANTCRNQLAEGFKYIDWADVDYNFDLGGGKYEKAVQWLLKERNVINLIYDPYNRSKDYNRLSLALSHLAQVTTIFNVLNVIQDPLMRKKVLEFGKREKTKHIYISIHDGNRSGIGCPTRWGWQENRSMKEFLPEIQEVYPSAYIKQRIIRVDLS